MLSRFFGQISERLGRTILIALAGQLFFIVSVITMIPLRMAENPVVNYNIFYMPLLAILFLVLFYRTCVENKVSRGYMYGYFAALVSWPLIGEVASMPVDKGLVTQFTSMNIKLIGGYFYVITGWVLLKILWRTKALKSSVCAFMMTFLSIWTFELYMDNYSSMVPLELMPTIGSWVTIVSSIVAIILLVMAWRTTSIEKKTLIGCILYIFVALMMMGGQWKKPQTFYVKYEAAELLHELDALKEEITHINTLKKYMLEEGMLSGKDIKYMLDRDLLDIDTVRDAVDKDILKSKDVHYLKAKGALISEADDIKKSH